PVAADEPVALFVPDRRTPGGGLLLVLLPATEATAEELAAATQVANDKLATGDQPPELPMAWQVAKRAIGERNRRPALLAVVTPLNLTRVVDLILAADEPALIAMSEQLGQVDPNSEQVNWLIESAMWRALLPRMERDELPAPLHAACTRHLGALGQDASTLLLLLRTANDGKAFVEAIIDENLAALGD